jgi:hypothetical protein
MEDECMCKEGINHDDRQEGGTTTAAAAAAHTHEPKHHNTPSNTHARTERLPLRLLEEDHHHLPAQEERGPREGEALGLMFVVDVYVYMYMCI